MYDRSITHENTQKEDEIYGRLPPGSCNLDITVRTGVTSSVRALENAACGHAATIIVINPDLNRTTDLSSIVIDLPVIHCLLALKQVERTREPECIVAEVSSRARMAVLRHIAVRVEARRRRR
jgi:hypothetical protein